MPNPITAVRKQTFLRALAETGNATLAAERARVSRDWVYKLRRRDAGFDAECREAVAVAKMMIEDDAALAPPHPPIASQRVPPSPATGRGAIQPADPRYRYQDGAETVVQRGRGRRVQVKRARLKQWTARTEQRFVEALAASCNVLAAVEAVGMSPPSAYYHRKRWPAFARAWDEAIAIGYCRLEAAVIQAMDYSFDPDCPPPEMDLGKATVADAIRLLQIYQRRR